MGKYVLKRILLALMTTFLILSLSFIFVKLLPQERFIGKPEQRIAYYEEQVRLGYMSSSKIERKDETPVDFVTLSNGVTTYYYTVPVMQQYGTWLKNIIFHWDWGVSKTISPNVKATVIIGEKLMTTIKRNMGSVEKKYYDRSYHLDLGYGVYFVAKLCSYNLYDVDFML